MPLSMTEDEIRTSYRDSKKPDQQIKILADLNGTTIPAIKEIVKGVTPYSDKKYNRLNADEAQKLHDAGKTTGEIAKALGVTGETVRNWKKRIGIINKQEESIMLEVNDTPVQLDASAINNIQAAQPEEQDAPAVPENTQTLHDEEHNAVCEINDLDDWIAPSTITTVGQRIDVILSQLRPSDCETVRKTFGLLCGRIISEHIGL